MNDQAKLDLFTILEETRIENHFSKLKLEIHIVMSFENSFLIL